MGKDKEFPHPYVLLRADETHCLETAARREYERLALSLLRGEDPGEGVEEKLELLREFLETTDFRSLRASSEGRIRERGEAWAALFRAGQEIRCVFLDP